MAKIRFIGDVHGHLYELKLVVENSSVDIDKIIQVGDLGVGFGQGDYWHESLDHYMVENNVYFLRGNHDNPETCKEMRNHLKEGFHGDFFVVPGAWSIDYQWRTPGVSWWEDEELSVTQFEHLISVYDITRPRVMVTHDIPHSVATQLFFKEGRPLEGRPQYKTKTGSALDAMFTIHKPELWLHGHWHYDVDEVIDGTRFICLNELSIADINRETLEIEFSPAWRPLHER